MTNGQASRYHRLAEEQGWVCAYCFCRLHYNRAVEVLKDSLGVSYKATIDHVVPRCRGGSNHLRNLVLSCGPCNQRKGSNEFERPKLSTVAFKGMYRDQDPKPAVRRRHDRPVLVA